MWDSNTPPQVQLGFDSWHLKPVIFELKGSGNTGNLRNRAAGTGHPDGQPEIWEIGPLGLDIQTDNREFEKPGQTRSDTMLEFGSGWEAHEWEWWALETWAQPYPKD